jgi:hypothetical protein
MIGECVESGDDFGIKIQDNLDSEYNTLHVNKVRNPKPYAISP